MQSYLTFMSFGVQIFEVEAILDHRKQANGPQQFKVKWKGYPMEDCTWQPPKNLENCMDMVKAFKIKRGLWFKSEPYTEPASANQSSQSECQEDGQFKKEIQSKESQEGEKVCSQQPIQDSQPQIHHQEAFDAQAQKQQLCKNTKAQMTILKMLKNEKNQIFFKVNRGKGIETFSRSQIYKLDIRTLLNFYEQYLEILPKS